MCSLEVELEAIWICSASEQYLHKHNRHDMTRWFIVRGPSGPLVVPSGGSVVLPCYVETPLVAETVKVLWKKTDSETVVHLYENGESQSEAQHKDYRDRAHFFTDQIQHGNFSLLLENVSAEDKGVYRCKVYSQQVADKTLVEIKDAEHLLVSGPAQSVSAYDGEDVTLNCSVDSHVTPEHIEEVSWKKKDKDRHILILLFQNNKSLSDASDERYRDRAEFFTTEILKGNFSLRLKSVRTEDKGVYMCQVFAGGLSANATAELVHLGFTWKHITLLILCIIASGFAVLLCWLVYSRSENQGSLYETISCCVLYILGPLRLFWVTPVATGFPELSMRKMLFLYGSAGLVLVNSAALMTELIMKAGKSVNTESSHMSTHCNRTPDTKHTSIDMNQLTGESHEMKTLRKVSGSSEEHQEEEIN
ncbi:junctional adhesion molecule-like [Garra rufa]|uniref:junctional adhesion molecule-like n=1 Tax=Garra rufa TaxID=137080 RepID=UPI003CCED1AB